MAYCAGVSALPGKSNLGDSANREYSELRVGNLKRQAVFSQLFPLFAPCLVQRALCIVGSGFRTGKLNCINAVKVANLVALSLEPYVPDARDLCRQSLNPRECLIF